MLKYFTEFFRRDFDQHEGYDTGWWVWDTTASTDVDQTQAFGRVRQQIHGSTSDRGPRGCWGHPSCLSCFVSRRGIGKTGLFKIIESVFLIHSIFEAS